jgi:DNA topoisomerase-2
LYNEQGYIKKYSNAEEIMDAFYIIRLTKYSERKENMLEEYDEELTLVSTKAQFIEDITDETVVMFEKVKNKMVNRSRENVIKQLEDLDYPTHQQGYDFLLHMRIDSFTNEMLNKLRKQIDALEEKIKILEKTAIQELWIQDLEEFQKEYQDYLRNWKSKNPV